MRPWKQYAGVGVPWSPPVAHGCTRRSASGRQQTAARRDCAAPQTGASRTRKTDKVGPSESLRWHLAVDSRRWLVRLGRVAHRTHLQLRSAQRSRGAHNVCCPSTASCILREPGRPGKSNEEAPSRAHEPGDIRMKKQVQACIGAEDDTYPAAYSRASAHHGLREAGPG